MRTMKPARFNTLLVVVALARLDKGLDEAAAKSWTVVSMKNDWNRIFAFESN